MERLGLSGAAFFGEVCQECQGMRADMKMRGI